METIFLWGAVGSGDECTNNCTCNCPLHGNSQQSIETFNPLKANEMQNRKNERNRKNKETNETAIKMIRRALTLLQVFTFAQFGCGNHYSIPFILNDFNINFIF